jgi:hypothetical protein
MISIGMNKEINKIIESINFVFDEEALDKISLVLEARRKYIKSRYDFSFLPNDVLGRITSYLCFSDILSLQLVNKRFFNLIESSKYWYHHVMATGLLDQMLGFNKAVDYKKICMENDKVELPDINLNEDEYEINGDYLVVDRDTDVVWFFYLISS